MAAEVALELACGVLEGDELAGAMFNGNVGWVPRGGGEYPGVP